MTKYHVSRVMQVLQATTIDATNESEAIEKSRKLKQKAWSNVDNKRRKGYKASKVEYPA